MTPKEWELRLYVAGQTPKSVEAFANLKRICEEHLEGATASRSSTCSRTPRSRAGIRSWPYRPWCESCPSR